MTDAELLHRYHQHADEDAFARLVERYSGLVYHTALRRTGNAETARDISQAVFLLVAQRAHRLKGGEGLAGWLHRAATLQARNAMRGEESRRRLMQNLEDSAGPGAPPAPEGLHPALPYLDEALEQLSGRDRDVLLEHYFHGRSYREIGALRRESEAAVQKRALRALQKLSLRLRRPGLGVSGAALATGLSLVLRQPAPAAVAGTLTPPPLAGRLTGQPSWSGWSAGRAAVLLSAAVLSGAAAFSLRSAAEEEPGARGSVAGHRAAINSRASAGRVLEVPRPAAKGWEDALTNAARLLRDGSTKLSETKAAWILTGLRPEEFVTALAWVEKLPGDDPAREPLAGLVINLWARHEPAVAWEHFREFPRKDKSFNESLVRHGSSVFLKFWSADPAGCMASLSRKGSANEPAAQMAVQALQEDREGFRRWQESLVNTPGEEARSQAAVLAIGAFPPGKESAAFYDWVAGIPFSEPGRQTKVLGYLAGAAHTDDEAAKVLGRWLDGLPAGSPALGAMQDAILQSGEEVRLSIIRTVRRPDILKTIQENL